MQYPHTMSITIPDSSVQNGDGNWETTGSVTREQQCRVEPNGSGKFLIASDGTQIVYAWTVYMPLPVEPIIPGATIEVRNGTELIATGKAIRFSEGQLNARLWL